VAAATETSDLRSTMTDAMYEWVREHVRFKLFEYAGMIGAESGENEKRLRLSIEVHVAEETAKLRQMIEDQSKTIQAQADRLAAVEAMFAQPAASVVDLKRHAS